MKVTYREGKKQDCLRIAELDNTASGGAIDFLFHDVVPNMTPVQAVAANLENPLDPYSYRSAIVAEYDKRIIGMSLSFPGKYHAITEEMKSFFPHDRIEHFKHFFTAPVQDSYYLDALCVDADFRNRGIGSRLIELTKNRARRKGFYALSLLVFKDNTHAQNVYKKNGFEVTGWVELAWHELMPHEGGCVLMKAKI